MYILSMHANSKFFALVVTRLNAQDNFLIQLSFDTRLRVWTLSEDQIRLSRSNLRDQLTKDFRTARFPAGLLNSNLSTISVKHPVRIEINKAG